MESTCDPKGYYDEGNDDSDEGDYGEGSMSLDIAAAVLLSDGSVAAVVAEMSADARTDPHKDPNIEFGSRISIAPSWFDGWQEQNGRLHAVHQPLQQTKALWDYQQRFEHASNPTLDPTGEQLGPTHSECKSTQSHWASSLD